MTNKKVTKIKRQACEVYSRVVGYLRPVGQWNDAKKEEYDNRVNFNVKQNEGLKTQQNKNGDKSNREEKR